MELRAVASEVSSLCSGDTPPLDTSIGVDLWRWLSSIGAEAKTAGKLPSDTEMPSVPCLMEGTFLDSFIEDLSDCQSTSDATSQFEVAMNTKRIRIRTYCCYCWTPPGATPCLMTPVVKSPQVTAADYSRLGSLNMRKTLVVCDECKPLAGKRTREEILQTARNSKLSKHKLGSKYTVQGGDSGCITVSHHNHTNTYIRVPKVSMPFEELSPSRQRQLRQTVSKFTEMCGVPATPSTPPCVSLSPLESLAACHYIGDGKMETYERLNRVLREHQVPVKLASKDTIRQLEKEQLGPFTVQAVFGQKAVFAR